MALKRRKILQEDLDLGTGTTAVPSDSGGTQTGTQINPALAYNTVGYKTAAMSGGDATITAEQDLTGATVSLNRNGIWLIIASFDMRITATVAIATLVGYINVDGSNQVATANKLILQTGTDDRAGITQTAIVSVTAQPITVKLRAARTSGTGTCAISEAHTVIRAVWLGVS